MALYGRRAVVREESIYNLIPRPAPKKEKSTRYLSTFRPQVQQEMKVTKAVSRTMGPAKVTPPATQPFLKKRSKEHRHEELGATKKAAETTLLKTMAQPTGPKAPTKPGVPRHTERPAMGVRTQKDFIKDNAVKAITSVPAKPAPKLVDTAMGATKVLDDSRTDAGLLPKYVNKKDYGETPEYLRTRNALVEDAQASYEAYVEEQRLAGEMNSVQEQEREEVLRGLKKHWQELHHQYLGLSVVTDTLPKKARKERLETEMKTLEHDIEMIQAHKSIYITPSGAMPAQ